MCSLVLGKDYSPLIYSLTGSVEPAVHVQYVKITKRQIGAKTRSKHSPLKSRITEDRLGSLTAEKVKKRMGRTAFRDPIFQTIRTRKRDRD